MKTLPGVREAIEQKNWKEAQEQISVLTGTLNNFNSKLEDILELM
ncbi:MAG: transferrin receptor-like dimerization domain-containing protein [Gillisia sp.]